MGKSLEFIKWDNLVNIPFAECEIKEDQENQDIDIYYRNELVFTDYNHVGHYLNNAITIFNTIKDKRKEWVNLYNLWTLRNCIRENNNHGLGLEFMIYGNRYSSGILEPMTKKRLFEIVEMIQKIDPYATI